MKELIENIDETKKLDIIGKIGQSEWNEKYCKLMKLLETDISSKTNVINNLKNI